MNEWWNWQMVGITSVVLVLLSLANEFGYRTGWAFDRDEADRPRTVANTIKVSVIGLVAFLLGFAFSISTERHDERRKVVLEEANAGGTLFLRASLLPAGDGDRLRAAYTKYLTSRIELVERNPSDEEAALLGKQMESQLAKVWEALEVANAKDRNAVLVSQVVPAANAVIDLDTTRRWAFRSHTPVVVLGVLLVCVLVSAGLIGHSFGQDHQRHVLLCLAFNLVFSLTLYLILDFDRPQHGMVQVDHTPLIELRDNIGATGVRADHLLRNP